MANLNDEMKSNADYVINAAKKRFGQELDYSEQSITKLEILLGKIYWGFSNRTKSVGEDGLIFNTATIWGSYLGEYMRLKWGGTWVLKDSELLVSINNIEISPINFVYQKITSHPEYNIKNYLIEMERMIYTSVIYPQQSQSISENNNQLIEQISNRQSEKPVTIDKRLIFTLVGIGVVLLVTLVSLIGHKIIKAGGISAFGLTTSIPASTATINFENTSFTATSYYSATPNPTVTLLPTYTPKPTFTVRPSNTPLLTFTPTATFTSTQTPAIPTPSQTRYRSPTPRRTPTDTQAPATDVPPPTATEPPPTVTEPPPPVIESCGIDPSSVPAGFNTPISFSAHFSAPGYGFVTLIHADNPGQSGCSATDDNGDGIAECDGTSGLLPSSTKVEVTFRSSVGDCISSFSSP